MTPIPTVTESHPRRVVFPKHRGATLPGSPLSPLALELARCSAVVKRHAYTKGMKIPRPTETAAVTRWSTCPECGESYEQDDTTNAYCDECKQQQRRETERQRDRGKTTTELGYGHRWQQLSKRARRQQDFCSDCGSTDDLTVDHSMEAWRAHEQGKTITLDMLDVVCRRCNGERGPARGPEATDEFRSQHAETFARIYADETD